MPLGRVGMARCPGKSRQTQERNNSESIKHIKYYTRPMRTRIPCKKPTTTFAQLQAIDTNSADPEIAVIRAAKLHRSPPIAVSMLSGTYHFLAL